jgi:hypothetical protein
MNPQMPNPQRRRHLATASKKTKAGDMLSLEELATLWGTAKSRFVNVKQDMIRAGYDFPPPVKGPKNSNLYDGRAALKVMLDYETRNDQEAASKHALIKQILGGDNTQSRDIISISELAVLNRTAAQAEERARQQGEFVPKANSAAIAGRVFSHITDFFGDLDARVDPNGELEKKIRARIRELGDAAITNLYDIMKDELSDDPVPIDKKRGRSPARSR